MKSILTVLCLLAACQRGPGETCKRSGDCLDGGSCLAGVCSGYACSSDLDCGALRCGSVAGSPVCVQDCDGDEDCAGQQSCREIRTDDTGGDAAICL